MSCFDETTCTPDKLINNINCNFTFKYITYMCNDIITCRRSDGLYDCCSSYISDCVIERLNSHLLPTIQPSVHPIIYNLCDTICEIAPSTNKCYWYEEQNKKVSCIDSNNNYCCSHTRSTCCQTNVMYVYIIFGSLLLVLFGFTYYKYILFMYIRVSPDNNNNINNNDTSSAKKEEKKDTNIQCHVNTV